MTDYTKNTAFTPKDSLPQGSPAKVVLGAELDGEFDEIETAIASKEDKASKGASNGYAGLDANAEVQAAQLPFATNLEAEGGSLTDVIIQPDQLRRAFELGWFVIGVTTPVSGTSFFDNITTTQDITVNGTADINTLLLTAAVNLPSGSTVNGSAPWTAANDGAGSGLHADLLDGQHGSFYQNAGNLNAGTIANARLGADVALHNQKNAWSAGEYTAESDITASASTTINANNSNVFDLSLGTNITTLTLSNMSNGQVVLILIRQQGTNTITFPAGWKWPGGTAQTVTSGSGSVDLLTLTQVNSVVYANMNKDYS